MTPAQLRRALWIARLYYFGFFAALGAFVSFFNVYLQERGMSGTQIGLISALPPFIALVSNPFWGGVADRWQAHQRVLALLAVVAGVTSVAFIWISGFWALLAVLSVVTFFRTPIAAIVDATVMGIIVQNPGVGYGPQRVFGSIGWVFATFGIGLIVTRYSINAIFVFHFILLAGMCGLLSLQLPVEPRTGGTVHYMDGLRAMVRLPSYRALLIFMTCFGAAMAAESNFLGLNILRLGGAATLIGIANAVPATVEVPVLFMSQSWFRRVNYRTTIWLCSTGFIIAWVLMAFASAPWHVIVIMGFLGFFFALNWTAIVSFANDRAPNGLRASAQAVAQAAHAGLGWALGSLLSGVLWDWGSALAVYLFAAAITTIGTVIFVRGTSPRATCFENEIVP
jgi:PPP family 3-phenylpropionic acid transporter